MTPLLAGVRMALRGSRTRVGAMALALAFTVVFLLAVLGALPARQAKLDRLAARQPVMIGTLAAPAGETQPSGVRVSSLFSTWRGRGITGFYALPGGTIAPPGVERLPGPGELVVSPALAEALRGPHGTELRTRLPGRVVGKVAKPGLSGPDELLAYVGVSRAPHSFPPRDVAHFGHHVNRADVPPDLRVAAQLGAVGLLLPVLVLVATATRLSAAARDRRLAAVRLVGASRGQTALVVAAEALLVGVVGALLGLAVFWALRPVAASLVPVEGGVFASDLLPPQGHLLLVLLGVPVLALLVSLFAMRRVVVDPLGVRRRARRRDRWGWWRLLPLGVGLGALGVLWVRASDLRSSFDVGLLLGGGGLTVLGLAFVAPGVSRIAGSVLVRLPGVASVLAGRRLLADPGSTARTLTGTVLVVFVGMWLLAFLPILRVSAGTEASELLRVLPGSTFHLSGSELDPRTTADLRAVPGVSDVVTIGTVMLAAPGTFPLREGAELVRTDLAVVACADLAALLQRRLPCGGSGVHELRSRVLRSSRPPAAGTFDLVGADGFSAAGRVALPRPGEPIDLGVDAWPLTHLAGVVDPKLLPARATRGFDVRLFVRNDGDPATVERVRDVLHTSQVYGAQTLDEQRALESRALRGYERAARLGLVLAVVVGGVALLVATADALLSRRRDLAALAAAGVPVGVLRRALFLEVLAPLLGCTVIALACGAYASGAYLAADGYHRDIVGLPWVAWATVGGLAIAVVLALTTVTLPLARASAHAQHLRTE